MVADVLHRDPQQVGAGRGGQRVRVRRPPHRPGQEAPAEELPGLRRKLVEVRAADVDRDHARALGLDPDHGELVPGERAQRDRDPVPQHQDGHGQVHRRPPEPRGQVVDERRADGELVAEGQRDGQVGVQVQVVPGLVANPPPRRAHRDDAYAEQQESGHRRHQHVRVLGEQRGRLAGQAGVRLDRVAPQDEQAVCDDHADDVPAAHRVPAGQLVGADAALQRREPRHQRDQDHHAVAGQQAEDLAGSGQPAAEPADVGGGVPPQRDHGERADPDDGQDRARAYPSAPFLRRNGPWRDLALSASSAAVGSGFAVAGGTGQPRRAGPRRIPWSGSSPFPPIAGLAGSYAQPGPYGSSRLLPFSYGYVTSSRMVQPTPVSAS